MWGYCSCGSLYGPCGGALSLTTVVLPGPCLKQTPSLLVLETTPSLRISHLDFSPKTKTDYVVLQGILRKENQISYLDVKRKT